VTAVDAVVRVELVTLALEATRIAGAVVVAPLPWSVAPLRARAGIVVILALTCHGQTLASGDFANSFGLVALAVPTEFLVGMALGFVIRLVVATVEIAADIIAPQMGLGAAHIFDPQTHATETPIAMLLRNFALLIAILAGLHRVLVAGLLASFRALPPGSVGDPSRATPALLMATAECLSTGVRMAVPVIAVLLLAQVALAFVSRAAPSMQIFSIGFAVTLIVGTAVVIVTLPDIATLFAGEASQTESRIENVLLALGAHTP
jgi:flagellar biosynthetic protein FliR